VAPGERLVGVDASGGVVAQGGGLGTDLVAVTQGSTAAAGTDVHPVLSPDGGHVATRGERPDEIVLAAVGAATGLARRLSAGGGTLTAQAFDPAGGRLLAAVDASAMTVWRVHDGSVAARVPVPAGVRVSGVAVNGAGTLLATYCPAGNAYLSDTASGESSTLPMRGVRALEFSPDGRWIGAVTDTDIRIWDVGLRQESPVRLPGGALALDGVADVSLAPVFSLDGAYVAAPRLSENNLRTSVGRVTDGSLVGEVAGYASDVAFLPDGRGVAVVGLGLFTTTFDPGRLSRRSAGPWDAISPPTSGARTPGTWTASGHVRDRLRRTPPGNNIGDIT
jgi:WD40 repeat protein